MKKLLKVYGFTVELQYYEMVVESRINGNISQAKSQFLAMPKANRKILVQELMESNNEYKTFFFDLL
jgi:hypothetical protein